MPEQSSHHDEILIVIVEDDAHHRHKLKEILNESFPICRIEAISHGIAAMNYLLTPVNNYHLVILDGKLDTFPKRLITEVNGPDVAAAMQEKNIKVPVVLFTQDPKMLQNFDEIFGNRRPEIEKPCRKSNVQAVLTPIIEAILNSNLAKETLDDVAIEAISNDYTSSTP